MDFLVERENAAGRSHGNPGATPPGSVVRGPNRGEFRDQATPAPDSVNNGKEPSEASLSIGGEPDTTDAGLENGPDAYPASAITRRRIQ